MMLDSDASAASAVDEGAAASDANAAQRSDPIFRPTGTLADAQTPTVTVSDPQQFGEGRNAHTLYKIEYGRGGDPPAIIISTVRRRYSDFRWLYQRMHAERPGSIVPIIPHRAALQSSTRFSDELLSERTANLNRFLRVVVAHPELEDAPSLNTFLTTDDEMFQATKRYNAGSGSSSDCGGSDAGNGGSYDEGPSMSSPPGSPDRGANGARKGGGERIRNLLARTSVAVSLARGRSELEATDDDPAFQEISRYVQSLDTQARTLSSRATILVDGTRRDAAGIEEFGQALFSISMAENREEESASATGSVAHADGLGGSAMLRRMSDGLAPLCALWTERAEDEDRKLDVPMKDLARDIQAAKNALQRRRERQVTYTTRIQQIRSRQSALERIQNNPKPGAEKKLVQAEQDLQAAKDAAEAAREELGAVSKRVMREVERFKVRMHEIVRQAVIDYAQIQVEYNRKLIDSWANLVLSGAESSGPK